MANSTLKYRDTATEFQIVKAIEELLRLSGYEVLRVGQWRADKAGNTPGTPDLFVTREKERFWLGIEVKTAIGRLSKAQGDLHRDGFTVVARSAEEALRLADNAFEVKR